MPSNIIATGNDLMVITDFKKLGRYLSTSFTIKLIIIRGIGGGLWGLRDPPETQKSQKETPPETPLKSSGIATTLKPDSNPPKNFGD